MSTDGMACTRNEDSSHPDLSCQFSDYSNSTVQLGRNKDPDLIKMVFTISKVSRMVPDNSSINITYPRKAVDPFGYGLGG